MLSTDSSPPDGDLPYGSYKSSPPLLRGSCRPIVERASGDDHDHDLLLQQEVELLIKSDSLPKFSIRDYVNSYRSKEIKTNWPFSQKNLQLCLKHGVKNPLPPFQPLQSVKSTQTFNQCAIEGSSLLEQGINGKNLDGKKLSEPSSDHVISNTAKKCAPSCMPSTLAADVSPDINLRRSSPKEKDFASTATTTHSQSEVLEPSVPYTNGLSSSLEEPPTLFEASTSAAEDPPPSWKGKKGRLLLKFGSNSSYPNTEAEDIASNCTAALSEAMASKTCPVCRAFSSSSNTTLNAHIDQCLSVESAPKLVPESNVNRHRIKSRKTRLMADICATALPCTLEELDRRNGSNWATMDYSISPIQDPNVEVCVKEKRHRTVPIYPGSNGDSHNDDDAGAVYIDASGTKLRILSKLNDTLPALRVAENPRLGKALKKNRGCKTFSTNKRRQCMRKCHRYLKLPPRRKQFGSLDSCKFKSRMFEDGNSVDKYGQEKKQPERQWICSKRTGLPKKVNGNDIHQVSGCELHAAQDFLIENNQSCLSNSCADRSCIQKSSEPLTGSMPTPGSNQIIENSIHEAVVNGYRELSPSRKRVGSPLLGSQSSDPGARPLNLSMKNVNPSRKDSTSVHNSCIRKLQKFNHTSSLSKKTCEIQSRPFRNSENSSRCNKKTSGLTRKPLSVGQSSIPESTCQVNKRYVTSMNRNSQFTGNFDEELVEGPSKVDQQYDLTSNHNNLFSVEVTGRVSPDGSNKPENKQGHPVSLSNWEKLMVTKSFQSEFRCLDPYVGRKIVGSMVSSENTDEESNNSELAMKDVQSHVEKICTGPSAVDVGETIAIPGKSFHHEYQKLTNPLDGHYNSPRSTEKHNLLVYGAEAPRDIAGSCSDHRDELSFADEVSNDISGEKTYLGTASEFQLENMYFYEFEPILIPGPPGSYLPSPRGMSSDDFQCSSSLTTSRFQSSHYQKELLAGDSSDSPISATSIISDPALPRYAPNYAENTPSSGPLPVSAGATVEPVTKYDARACLKVRKSFPEGGNLEVNEIIPRKCIPSSEDDRVCCCSWKERISATIALNSQDSQLLRRRTISKGHQMGFPPTARTHNSNVISDKCRFGESTSSGDGKVLLPMKVNSDAAASYPSLSDTDSACPSASSPILRLMGKNLMVVNKDVDTSTQFTRPQPVLKNYSTAQLLTGPRVSPVNAQNQDFNPFRHAVTQGPDTFFHDPHRMACFEKQAAKGFQKLHEF